MEDNTSDASEASTYAKIMQMNQKGNKTGNIFHHPSANIDYFV